MAGDRPKHSASTKRDPATHQSAKESQKRKRDLDSSTGDTSKPDSAKKAKKTRKSSSAFISQNEKSQKGEAPASPGLQKGTATTKSAVSPDSKAIPISNDGGLGSQKKSKTGRRRSQGKVDSAIGPAQDIDKTKDAVVEKGSMGRTSSKSDKFSGIMSKFQRTVKAKDTAPTKEDEAGDVQDSEMTDAPEPVVARGLEPLPQPEPTPVQVEKPSYSSLPNWLAHPLRASTEEKTKFAELGLDPGLLRALETNGYKEAFAVQSTVLPLLLPGPNKHFGDVCISAATGSGKTLAYVLPLVKALKRQPAPRFRGLIIVPTRELVKQARETCELLAAGSGLRIGSAIGNVPMRDEQRSLMRTDAYCSPELYRRQEEGDYGNEFWSKFNIEEYLEDIKGRKTYVRDYVDKKEPNVDILICTPGRLVDHIRNTRGFTLAHVDWLIIDEADRLLNESFQEWVGVVMKSLDDRKVPETYGTGGKWLAKIGYPLQRPEPKKVILSATMTRDISKLNTLRLAYPKMVIIGSEDNAESGEMAHSDDHFTLPPTLKEYAVSVGDGSEKPLYLLRLLLCHIKVDVTAPTKRLSPATSDSDDTSSDDTSSDDTSSDGSSETSSSEGSDSESSEDESSESESSSSSEDEDSDDGKPKPGPARNTVLIFTKSSEAASRLSRLLSILHPPLNNRVGTIIKSNKTSASRKALTAYRAGKVSIIVATDRASRGLDLRSLKHVINYDVPASITSYVHRVGRTARAGETGVAWTLVAHREGRWFGAEIAKNAEGKIIRSTKLERVNMKLDGMGDIKKKYAPALEKLEEEVKTGGRVKK